MKLDDALNIGWWVCLLVALAGCATPIVAVPIILTIPWARITTLQGLEERTHAEFPDGTALLEARYARSIDGGGFAKLSVPREHVPELLNATVFAGAPRSQSERNLTNYYGMKPRNEPDWWQPDEIQQFVAIDAFFGSPPTNQSLQVLVDMSNSQNAIVYLYFTIG